MGLTDSEKVIRNLKRKATYVQDKQKYLLRGQKTLVLIIILLILGIAASFYFVIYDYHWGGKKANIEEELVLAINNPIYDGLRNQLRPSPLRITSNQILKNNKNNFDFVSYLTNPNDLWYAEFDYHFESGSYKGDIMKGFILPKQNRPFWDLDVKYASSLSTGKIIIGEMEWKRATNYDLLRRNYLNFSFDEIILKKASDLDEEAGISRLSFIANNNSIYNVWKLGLAIIFKRYDDTVAFYYYELEDFLGEEERLVDLTLFEDLKSITNVDVLPIINIYNEDNRFID